MSTLITDPLFWDGLVAAGIVSQEQLDACLKQHRLNISLGAQSDIAQLLMSNFFAEPAAIHEYLQQKGISEAGSVREPLLPPSVCLKYRVIPLRIVDRTLIVQAARSLDYTARLMIMAACTSSPEDVETRLVDRPTMARMLSRLGEHRSFEGQVDQLMRGDRRADDLRLVIEALLHEAIDRRSSDIHLDRKPDPESFVSLRVDSRLQQSWVLRESVMAAIISRIKSMSGVDASESRKAQDGRMQIEHRGRTVSFRVACQPIVNGETVSIRVIDAAMLPAIAQLYPNQPEMHQVMHSIATTDGKSGGLVLITGSTGSGKSTTLYSLVSAIPRDRRNVVTVEDPVEFVLPFVRQIMLNQLLAQKAVDFERSVLRQDPDVLVFGEIRDADSARTALKFAESGHLVIASLHSQNALQAVERMLSVIGDSEGAEAALVIAQTILTVTHQKLVPKLCDCKAPFDSVESYSELASALGEPPPSRRWRAVGCPKCEGTGYRGRALMHETLLFDMTDEERHVMSTHLVRQHSLKGQDNPPFHLVRRSFVASRLLAAGVIDDQVAIRSLRGAFSEASTMEAA